MEPNLRYNTVPGGETISNHIEYSHNEVEATSPIYRSYVENNELYNNGAKNEEYQRRSNFQTFNWVIGWKTPTIMVVLYVLGESNLLFKARKYHI